MNFPFLIEQRMYNISSITSQHVLSSNIVIWLGVLVRYTHLLCNIKRQDSSSLKVSTTYSEAQSWCLHYIALHCIASHRSHLPILDICCFSVSRNRERILCLGLVNLFRSRQFIPFLLRDTALSLHMASRDNSVSLPSSLVFCCPFPFKHAKLKLNPNPIRPSTSENHPTCQKVRKRAKRSSTTRTMKKTPSPSSMIPVYRAADRLSRHLIMSTLVFLTCSSPPLHA